MTSMIRYLRHIPTLTIALAVFIVVSLPIISVLLDFPVASFMRDPTQVAGVPPYVGFVSSFGVVAWAAAATVALFTFTVLRLDNFSESHDAFFAKAAILSFVLLADDLLLLHEHAPLSETAIFSFYTIYVFYMLFLCRHQIKSYPPWYGLSAACFFALSLLVDLFQFQVEAIFGVSRILIEDGSKFLGIVCWACYIWNSALLEVGKRH